MSKAVTQDMETFISPGHLLLDMVNAKSVKAVSLPIYYLVTSSPEMLPAEKMKSILKSQIPYFLI